MWFVLRGLYLPYSEIELRVTNSHSLFTLGYLLSLPCNQTICILGFIYIICVLFLYLKCSNIIKTQYSKTINDEANTDFIL
jgi:hypothetical protein